MDDRLLLGVWHLTFGPALPIVERLPLARSIPPLWMYDEVVIPGTAGGPGGRRQAFDERLALLTDEFERSVHEFLLIRRTGQRRKTWAEDLTARLAAPSPVRGARLRAWLVQRLSIPGRNDILALHRMLFTRLFRTLMPAVESVRTGRGGAPVFVAELHPTNDKSELVLPAVIRRPLDLVGLQNRMRHALLQSGLTLQQAGERMGYSEKNARLSVQSLLTSHNPGLFLVDRFATACGLSLVELLLLPAEPVAETRQKAAARRKR